MTAGTALMARDPEPIRGPLQRLAAEKPTRATDPIECEIDIGRTADRPR